jgi:hypothetical protein
MKEEPMRNASQEPHTRGGTVAAPWDLTGSGTIIPRWFARGAAAASRLGTGDPCAGLGALMLVRYDRSPVGPYDELLFLAPPVLLAGRRYHTIPTIYVSTEASARSGARNWALPKQVAEFSRTPEPGGAERVEVRTGGVVVFRARVAPRGPHLLPLSSRVLPMPLAQRRGGELVVTRFTSRGWAALAWVTGLETSLLPQPAGGRVAALHLSRVRLTFPVPQVLPLAPAGGPVVASWGPR